MPPDMFHTSYYMGARLCQLSRPQSLAKAGSTMLCTQYSMVLPAPQREYFNEKGVACLFCGRHLYSSLLAASKDTSQAGAQVAVVSAEPQTPDQQPAQKPVQHTNKY